MATLTGGEKESTHVEVVELENELKSYRIFLWCPSNSQSISAWPILAILQ